MKPPFHTHRIIRHIALTASLGCASLVLGDEPSKGDANPAPAVQSVAKLDGSGWIVDLERAKTAAAESGKDLLLYFSGSDWCPPCMVLDEQYFSKESFINEFSEKFILVLLDFPRGRDLQSKELEAANDKANTDYNVTAYPTLYLTDDKGRPYAMSGYQQLPDGAFSKVLMDLHAKHQARDEAFKAAETATGVAKANLLSGPLKDFLPQVVLKFYEPEFREIVKSDPENYGGMGLAVYYDRLKSLEKELDAFSEKQHWNAVLRRIDQFLEEEKLNQVQQQEVEFFKLGSFFNLRDMDRLEKSIDKIIALAPKNVFGRRAQELKNSMPQFRKQVEEEAKKEKAAEANPQQ